MSQVEFHGFSGQLQLSPIVAKRFAKCYALRMPLVPSTVHGDSYERDLCTLSEDKRPERDREMPRKPLGITSCRGLLARRLTSSRRLAACSVQQSHKIQEMDFLAQGEGGLNGAVRALEAAAGGFANLVDGLLAEHMPTGQHHGWIPLVALLPGHRACKDRPENKLPP